MLGSKSVNIWTCIVTRLICYQIVKGKQLQAEESTNLQGTEKSYFRKEKNRVAACTITVQESMEIIDLVSIT